MTTLVKSPYIPLFQRGIFQNLLPFNKLQQSLKGRACPPVGREGGEENSFQKFLAGPNLDIQHIFPGWENTDELLVVSTRGMVSHIEV